MSLGGTANSDVAFPPPLRVYNWVPAKYLGLTLRWTSIPFGGEGRGGEGRRIEVLLITFCY